MSIEQDRGIVAILDPRILTKNYGNAFLRALPRCPVEVVQKLEFLLLSDETQLVFAFDRRSCT